MLYLFVLSFHSLGYVISYTEILSGLLFVVLPHRGTSHYLSPNVWTVRCGGQSVTVRIACVDCLQPCGPRSNVDFAQFV